MFIPEVSLCLSPTAAAAGWPEQLSSTHCTNKSTDKSLSLHVRFLLPSLLLPRDTGLYIMGHYSGILKPNG